MTSRIHQKAKIHTHAQALQKNHIISFENICGFYHGES